eukprot:10935763-Lingulodinium_polyedra.AAC.1
MRRLESLKANKGASDKHFGEGDTVLHARRAGGACKIGGHVAAHVGRPHPPGPGVARDQVPRGPRR